MARTTHLRGKTWLAADPPSVVSFVGSFVGSFRPFLVSIGERAEALIALYEDRRISTQEALARFEALAQEYVEADAQRQALGVDANSFAIYTALQPLVPGLPAAQATALDALFRQHPDYNWDIEQTNALRAALYQILRPLVGRAQLMAAANGLLRLQRV